MVGGIFICSCSYGTVFPDSDFLLKTWVVETSICYLRHKQFSIIKDVTFFSLVYYFHIRDKFYILWHLDAKKGENYVLYMEVKPELCMRVFLYMI